MFPTQQGSFRLFRLFSITVHLHWSWFIIAVLLIQTRSRHYESPIWNIAEYLALFAIVLLHEFGHALACRQTGGRADQIVLWPLGGVAYVSPPDRPGAHLWSIAAGPLVNVLLVPVFYGLIHLGAQQDWATQQPNLAELVRMLALINFVLLVFNLLPVYPLDGGQILRALLWFPLGRSRSLLIATLVGLLGGGLLLAHALRQGSIWLVVLAAFLLFNSWRGWLQARSLRQAEKNGWLPR